MSGRGGIRVPGDKSISHRALILGALADGESRIEGILQSADVQSTASILRTLGVSVPDLSDSFTLPGRGLQSLKAPGSTLDAGNSGTTVRLMSGVVAGFAFASRFEGDASLSRRPMKRISEPLTAMGARFEFARDDGLPMTIQGGRLSGIVWNTRSASAQTKSAILFAGLVGGVHVSVRESQKSRDHTERMLVSMGAPVEHDDLSVSLSPVNTLAPLEITVPGDPSSAAFLIALGVLGQKEVVIDGVCINKTRLGFIEQLIQMGADIECSDSTAVAGDTVATITARPSQLDDVVISADRVPAMIDELPLLGCVAAAARITLEVSGAAELRVKESDRISTLVANLNAIGARAQELPDGFRVFPASGNLRGRVRTEGDHRIAMAFGILGALPGNTIEVDDPECVGVSYPGFWDTLARINQ